MLPPRPRPDARSDALVRALAGAHASAREPPSPPRTQPPLLRFSAKASRSTQSQAHYSQRPTPARAVPSPPGQRSLFFFFFWLGSRYSLALPLVLLGASRCGGTTALFCLRSQRQRRTTIITRLMLALPKCPLRTALDSKRTCRERCASEDRPYSDPAGPARAVPRAPGLRLLPTGAARCPPAPAPIPRSRVESIERDARTRHGPNQEGSR